MFSGFIFSGFYEYSDDDEDFFDESEKSTVDFYGKYNLCFCIYILYSHMNVKRDFYIYQWDLSSF